MKEVRVPSPMLPDVTNHPPRAITKATTDGFEEMQAAGDKLEEANVSLPTSDVTEELEEAAREPIEEPQTEIEIEFRALVSELMANGVEPSDMVDDPRWEPINERAAAVGFETWPVFMELTSVQ